MSERKPARRESRSSRPTLTLTAGWAAAILALLVVLFFHETFLGGKTFVSPDASAPAGFVRVGEDALCSFDEECPLRPVWSEAQNELVKRLKGTNFATLLERSKVPA